METAVDQERALEWLQARWPGGSIWYGKTSRRWWALTPGKGVLVDAPTPADLDALLRERLEGL